jgi:cellulose synthase/poly-beta-1,6-N-acetylglucosamine synthase-like glycosyltransferase
MVETLFYIFLTLILYTYIGYPLLCSLAFLSKRAPAPDSGFRPSISLIIPCHNEENIIRRKLENSLLLDYPAELLEIIVASESTDGTDAIVKEFAPRVCLINSRERCGKTALMYLAVPRAHNDVLAFSDANVMLDPAALSFIGRHYADARVGAVGGSLHVTNPAASSVSRGEHLYKSYESFLRRANSRMGRVLGVDGALFSLRKELYNPLSRQRGDDFELVIRVLLAGKRSIFEPRAHAFEDASVDERAEIGRKVRMVSWFLRSSVILLKEMLLKLRLDLIAQLLSHKLLRWLTPYCFAGMLLTNGLLARNDSLFAAMFLLQTLWYTAGILGWGIARYFLVYNYGFLLGTLKGCFKPAGDPAWEKMRA